MKKLFGTDGIRGVANRELTPEMAYRIGRICAFLLKEDRASSFIVVGKDTRKSGDMLESAINAGICSSVWMCSMWGYFPHRHWHI